MNVSYATGRTYDFPQVLEIQYDAETKTAIFADRSRGIDGKVDLFFPVTENNIGPMVLRAYDAGQYRHPSL
jgi:hypothetical protein